MAEDAALEDWRRRSVDYERAIARRARVIAKAQDQLERAMRPLTARRYESLEQAHEDGQVITVASYARLVGDVRSYLDTVRVARDKLNAVTAAEGARVTAARRARAVAARTLLALPPLPDAAVGVSRQQLGTYARDDPG